MSEAIVIYDSLTGNTKKIAQAIASVGQWESARVNEAPRDLREYGLVVLGSPDMNAKSSQAVTAFMNTAILPKNFALFLTFGAPVWGQISSMMCLEAMAKVLSAKGSRCIGRFICPGFHAKYKTYKGRPNDKDLLAAAAFAKKLQGALRG